MVDLFVDRAVKVIRQPSKQNGSDNVRMNVDFGFSSFVQQTVLRSSPVSLCQANMLWKDRIQDPLVGLPSQQLVRDGSMYYSPVPVQQVFIIPTILSRYFKVPRAIPTSASVLCNVNILYRLIGDIKLTYFIVEQKTTLRFAAVLRYRHILSRLSRFHCRGREHELFCLVQATRGLRDSTAYRCCNAHALHSLASVTG